MRVKVRAAISMTVLAATLSMVGHTQTSVRPQEGTPAKVEHLGGTSAKARIGPTHGTVNVFLANKNGLVVVTDSLLGNGIIPVGFGQKLFQVDDHTICS